MPQISYMQSSVPWKPHAYQKKGAKFLIEHAASALFLDPGLGKTSITLAAIKVLKKKKLISKVLLIAPLRVCHGVWPREIQKWDDFSELTYCVLHGPDKEELLKQDFDIYIINPEGLEWLTQAQKVRNKRNKISVQVDVRRWKRLGFDTLVVDELSKFKHIQSIRFKMMKPILNTFARRWGLTGSPASNGLMDLFGQCYLLDEGRSLGKFITHYRKKYFDQSFSGHGYTLKSVEAAEQIYERIAPLALRMSAEDYLEMPKLVVNNIPVDMPEGASEAYAKFEAVMVANISSKIITAGNAGVASMKCRQIANGAVYVDEEVEALVKLPKGRKEWVEVHDGKVDALAELIDELQGEPLLVAYEFSHDLERILKRLGKNTPYIGGGTSTQRCEELVTAWNAGELPVMLGHPQSIGHGLNLQESGHHVAWFSITWDYDLYDQFIRRMYRQGNKSRQVFVHHLVATGTIDELILQLLKSKRRGQNQLFDALKKYAQSRK